mgnify:CR=1 FL=1
MFHPISVTLTLKVRRRSQRPKRGRITGMIIPRNPPTLKSPAMIVKNPATVRSLARARSPKTPRSPVATPRNPDERKIRARIRYKKLVYIINLKKDLHTPRWTRAGRSFYSHIPGGNKNDSPGIDILMRLENKNTPPVLINEC